MHQRARTHRAQRPRAVQASLRPRLLAAEVATAAQRAPRADRRDPVERVAGSRLARDGVAPGEHRRTHRLVVADTREVRRRTPEQAAHRAHAEALERRHGEVAVEVVAVRGIHVRAHPQAGVGDARARRRRPLGDARQRRRGLGRAPAAAPSPAAAAASPAARGEPRLDERVVVVAGDDDELAPGERSPEILEELARGQQRLARRTVAQLEHVAEQH